MWSVVERSFSTGRIECSTNTSGKPTQISSPSNALSYFACLRVEASIEFNSDSLCNKDDMGSVNGIFFTPLTDCISPSASLFQRAVNRKESDNTRPTILFI